MKKLRPFLLLGLVVLSACANRYRITLNNGNVIDTRTKPRLDAAGMTYHFKDATGREAQVTAIRIREIAPR